MFPKGEATEDEKTRKVTHVSGRRSDGSDKTEKGHPFFQKVKRRGRQNRERSPIFLEGIATEMP